MRRVNGSLGAPGAESSAIESLFQLVDRFLPQAAGEDEIMRLRGRILVSLAFGMATVITVGWVLREAISPLPMRITVLATVCLVALVAGPFLLRLGQIRAAGITVSLAVFSITFGSVFMAGGLRAPVLILAPTLPVLATILIDLRFGIGVLLAIGMLCGVLLILPHYGLIGEILIDTEGETRSRALLVMISCLMAVVLATFYDTQQRIASREKASSEERYRTIFERTKEILVLSTPDGTLVDINPAGLELYGFASKDDFLRHTAKDFYVNGEERASLISRIQAEGFVRDLESRQVLQDGSLRTLRGTTSVLREVDGEIELLLAILRDVSEEQAAEREKEAVLQRLAAKNDELERFAYTISHDLKSPLLTIKGFLGLLQKDLAEGRPQRADKNIATIARATDKMGQLLDDLLDYARLGHAAEGWAQVSMSTMVGEAVELLSGRIAERGVRVEVQEGLPMAFAPPALLRMIVLNLLDNAVKFARSRVEVGAHRDDGQSRYFVRDDGPGLAREDQDRIFGLFEKADPGSTGTGIGLASVQRAIEVCGGQVWVESALGEGASFFFTLPGHPKNPVGEKERCHEMEENPQPSPGK